jgi:tellurite resistance protein TehA-like permease
MSIEKQLSAPSTGCTAIESAKDVVLSSESPGCLFSDSLEDMFVLGIPSLVIMESIILRLFKAIQTAKPRKMPELLILRLPLSLRETRVTPNLPWSVVSPRRCL